MGSLGRRSRAICEFPGSAGVFAAEPSTLYTGTGGPAGSVFANQARKWRNASPFVLPVRKLDEMWVIASSYGRVQKDAQLAETLQKCILERTPLR